MPKGRTANLIKSIFSVLAILVLIKPILSITNIENGEFYNFFETDVTLQEDYLYYANAKKIENYEIAIGKMIKEKGLSTSKVEIVYKEDEDYCLTIEKVFLNIDKKVISENEGHKLVIEEIKNAISTFLNVKKDILVVYE